MSVAGVGAVERDVTVDGFHGKQIQYTVPDYGGGECLGDMFGLFQEDIRPASDAAPGPVRTGPRSVGAEPQAAK